MPPTRPPPPTRPNWPLFGSLAALIGLFVVYVWARPWAVADSLLPTTVDGPLIGSPAEADLVFQRVIEFLLGTWIFVFGACIGSFLNVVIYRVPRGMTLLGTSHCPQCGHAIRPYDNVPVFGWLALRGRCRDCRLPISPRYPLIEATVGSLILLLAHLEVLANGVSVAGSDGLIGVGTWPFPSAIGGRVGLCAYHSLLIVTLLAWAAIEWDGQRIPRSFVWLVLGLGCLIPALWPAVHPVSWRAFSVVGSRDTSWLNRVDTTLIGLLAGGLVGWLIGKIPTPGPRDEGGHGVRGLGPPVGFGVVGLFLGWQAVFSVAIVATLLGLSSPVLGRRWSHFRRRPWLPWILVASVAQICIGEWLSRWMPCFQLTAGQ